MSGTKVKNKVKSESVEEKLARMEKENEELKTELAQSKAELAQSKGAKSALEKIKGFTSPRATAVAQALIYNPLRKTSEVEAELMQAGYKPRSGFIACVRATIAVMVQEEFLDNTIIKHYEGQ